MTLHDFYNSIGADYNAVLGRLMNREDLVKRYLLLFLEDDNFAKLTAAVQDGDYNGVEVSAHSIKGITSNLELTALCAFATDMVSAVRAGETDKIGALFAGAEQAYNQIVQGVNALT